MDIHEKHPELMHYTSSHGLYGIVTSKNLWASHLSFLNDDEELVGFFERVLPQIVRAAIVAAYGHEGVTRFVGKNDLREQEPVEAKVREITLAFKLAQVRAMDHYALSFCTAANEEVRRHGLLSQWRGYGPKGGYALVFDSNGMNELMKKDASKYSDESLLGGDVEYDLEELGADLEPETKSRISRIQAAVTEFIKSNNPEALFPTFQDITMLAVLSKHRGFREEREVRYVAGEPSVGFLKAHAPNSQKPWRKIHYAERNGALVPTIHLFEDLALPNLPIKHIIVGPNPQKRDRKNAVERLLISHGIEAEVLISDIPYRGN